MTPREAALIETLNATMSLNHALEAELSAIRTEESEILKEARTAIARANAVSTRRSPTDTEVQKFWADFRRKYTAEDLSGDDYAWHNLFPFQRDAIRAAAEHFNELR